MAGHNAPASGRTDADYAAHEKTYRGFLVFLLISGGATVVTLFALYFFLAR